MVTTMDMILLNMNKKIGVLAMLIFFSLLAYIPVVQANPGLTYEAVRTWYWTGDTRITSLVVGDVDGDPTIETVTVGYFNDGTRDVAQLCVWDAGPLKDVKTWYWIGSTEIRAVAYADVDADSSVEIVTGGHYWDGTCFHAQLCVWDGATLALEDVRTWYWGDDTVIFSIVCADVDSDGQMEIVTGGHYNDGTRFRAQLCVWEGANLVLENVQTWYWVDSTYIWSVACANVDGDAAMEIVTGGTYWDGIGRFTAQLCVWDGTTLALEDVQTWYWTGSTEIASVAMGDVDGDSAMEIVTGGYYYDGTNWVAQLCVWTGSTLALEDVTTWCWHSSTGIYSVVCENVDGDSSVEIITGGRDWDGTRFRAQLCVWDGTTLALEDVTTWYWTGSTEIASVAVGDVLGTYHPDIVTGGRYYDGTRYVAQMSVWGFT
jgi:hypothetical protein